jgi:hypothetical protein
VNRSGTWTDNEQLDPCNAVWISVQPRLIIILNAVIALLTVAVLENEVIKPLDRNEHEPTDSIACFGFPQNI